MLGIDYIGFILGGANYESSPNHCFASYIDFDYLKKYWEIEKQYLVEFCRILGLPADQFSIRFPKHPLDAICITFLAPLQLELKEDIEESDELELREDITKSDGLKKLQHDNSSDDYSSDDSSSDA